MTETDKSQLIEAVTAKQTLYSVFDRITLGHAKGKLNNQLKARRLTNENIVEEIAENDQVFSTGLEDALNLIDDQLEEPARSETFFYVLQKYGWRIRDPKNEEDTRLAVAFCDSFRVKKAMENVGDNDTFILLKGDLTGIQKYIYGNIQPKRTGGLRKIAKKLRGRSIIVSLITDFLANVVLRELELPIWHLLFAGGGHFNLLLPNNETVRIGLESIEKELDVQMRKCFGDNLQLIVARQTVSRNQIEKAPGFWFSKLNSELERQKFQEHKGQLDFRFNAKPETGTVINGEHEEFVGKKFPKQHFLVETFSQSEVNVFDAVPLFSLEMPLGIHSLLATESLKDAENLLFNSASAGLKSAQIFSLNTTENFLPSSEYWNYDLKSVGFGFRFLGKTVPIDEERDEPKTFEEIVETDELKMLAALRLDVDDLGFIFGQGIPNASLGEIVTLSREMQYFFSAHFDQLAAKPEHDLYLIYSGGDDAFVVGKWDNIIAFAAELHTDFEKFTYSNPDVHFSAGIYMGNPHYPVGRFYREAVDLQDAAKGSGERKNKVNIFNHILNWKDLKSKIELGETFFEALKGFEKSKFNSAFAYRILNLVKTSFYERSGIDKYGQTYHRGSIHMERFARNVASMRYLFARHGFDEKKAEEQVGKLEKALIGDFLRSFDFADCDTIKSTRDYLVGLNIAILKQRATAEKKIIKSSNHDEFRQNES